MAAASTMAQITPLAGFTSPEETSIRAESTRVMVTAALLTIVTITVMDQAGSGRPAVQAVLAVTTSSQVEAA